MQLVFTKMNGAGNDFVLIDNRAGDVMLSAAQVVHLCHRQRGVGADGLILLKSCASDQADWAWDFFNSDGSSRSVKITFISICNPAVHSTGLLTGKTIIV